MRHTYRQRDSNYSTSQIPSGVFCVEGIAAFEKHNVNIIGKAPPVYGRHSDEYLLNFIPTPPS